MATKKEKAAAAAQKEFNKQLAATKALASKTTAKVNTLTSNKTSITTPFDTGAGKPTGIGTYSTVTKSFDTPSGTSTEIDIGTDTGTDTGKEPVVPGLRKPGSGNPIYQMLGGILYYDGKPFTGKTGNTDYIKGVAQGKTGKGGTTPDVPKETPEEAKDRYDREQAALRTQAEKETEKRDAFALIEDTMRAYGFTASEMGELNTYIQNAIINPSLGPNGAILGMKQLNVYKQRFAGNETLVKTGKNALSEYDYLQQENAYSEYLKAYGVENLGNRETFATLIGNSVSGTEVQKRVSTAVDRVKNSDPQIMAQLKTYYPTLTDNDLVSYFLNPKQALPDLQRKVTASEIGAAAVGQGFRGATDALGLADYGVDRATALEGYSNIAGVLPEATKLGDIYGETGVKYTQQSGEEEFLKQNEAAKRKRNILASKERANFEGSAGNAPGAYSTSYLRKSSSSGLI